MHIQQNVKHVTLKQFNFRYIIPVILPHGRLNLLLLRPSTVLPKKIKISRLLKISIKEVEKPACQTIFDAVENLVLNIKEV
jgi:hypothetical protein